jgi:hypothetical protein
MSGEVISFDDMCNLAEGFSKETFNPFAQYHAGSDSLFIQFTPGTGLRERVDGRLTIQKDIDSGEIIGAQIKGFRALCSTIAEQPGFKVWTSLNNTINVGYLLMLQVLKGGIEGVAAIHYVNLSKRATELEVEPALCEV